MTGDLVPCIGTVTRHSHLSIGRYHQHSVDQLIDDMTVLEFLQHTYPNTPTFKREVDEWRSFIGRWVGGGLPRRAPPCTGRSRREACRPCKPDMPSFGLQTRTPASYVCRPPV